MKSFLFFLMFSLSQASLYACESEHKRTAHNSTLIAETDLTRARTIAEAFNQLPHKNKPINAETVHNRMGRNLQRHIEKFLPYLDKLPIYYPKQLIPAIMQFSDTEIYQVKQRSFITDIKCVKPRFCSAFELFEENEADLKKLYAAHAPQEKNKKPYIVGQTRFLATDQPFFFIDGIHIQHYGKAFPCADKSSRVCMPLEQEEWRDGPDDHEDHGFTSHIYNDGIILFKIHHKNHRRTLKQLTPDQCDYITALYELHRQSLINANRGIISLSQQQIQCHGSLPNHVQANLENNYHLATIRELRMKERRRLCKITIAMGAIALPVCASILSYMQNKEF